jgi:hypothetical protein
LNTKAKLCIKEIQNQILSDIASAAMMESMINGEMKGFVLT